MIRIINQCFIMENNKWTLPVEYDEKNDDYFITFPEELLQQTGWKPNDTLIWNDNQDGTWSIQKKETRNIQTFGSYNPEDGYTFSIAFGDGPAMTLDGLTKEDIFEIASCAVALLPDEDYRTLLSPDDMIKYYNNTEES